MASLEVSALSVHPVSRGAGPRNGRLRRRNVRSTLGELARRAREALQAGAPPGDEPGVRLTYADLPPLLRMFYGLWSVK